MSKFVTLHGFGGGSSDAVELNFDVKRYDSEEELLADTPSVENTIGIVSDTEISKWSFDSYEPENPVEGMLWIKIGTESQVEFNAIKDADIPVYPLSTKQYVGSMWINKTAKSYQGNKWVSWICYLYRYGDEYIDITGGWGLSTNIPNVTHGESLSKQGSYMRFASSYVHGGHYADGFLLAKNKINLTSATKITAIIKDASITLPIYLCVSETDYYRQDRNAIAKTNISTGDTSVSLDVTDLVGKYYVGIAAAAGSWNCSSSVSIEEIYFN